MMHLKTATLVLFTAGLLVYIVVQDPGLRPQPSAPAPTYHAVAADDSAREREHVRIISVTRTATVVERCTPEGRDHATELARRWHFRPAGPRFDMCFTFTGTVVNSYHNKPSLYVLSQHDVIGADICLRLSVEPCADHDGHCLNVENDTKWWTVPSPAPKLERWPGFEVELRGPPR